MLSLQNISKIYRTTEVETHALSAGIARGSHG